jgi:hypothetical protein
MVLIHEFLKKSVFERKKLVDELIDFRCSQYEGDICDSSIYRPSIFETTPRPSRENDDLQSIRQDLEEVGYCRLRALSDERYEDDRQRIYSQMVVDFAERMSINPNNTDIIPSRNLLDITFRSGIVSYGYQLYHSPSMWMVRGHPALVEPISAIYGCPPENLCVSYDTVGIRYSPEFIYSQICRLEYATIREEEI